ncbi:MAG: polyprenyl synthetase family protein [Pseudomonadota bacterium]
MRLNQLNSFYKIKNLAKNDLSLMDEVIKSRLLSKAELIQDVSYHIINSGGKRLRPILLILIAKLFGYIGNRHINLAATVEFIHTATLLHDDVVDHSNTRRGKPTANLFWDNKSSILVGDFLFSQSFLLMAEDGDSKILGILSKAASIIAEGEVKQLTASIANLHLSIDEYLQVISAKTAELFAASCQVGAIIAGASVKNQQAMYDFGLNLGISFQIIDDILDYTSNSKTIGKDIGDDFKESKVTLPIILAYKNSNEKEFWERVINDKNQREGDFQLALEYFNKYEVVPHCLKLTKEFLKKAKLAISTAPNNEIRSSLIDLLEFSINREF